MPTQLFQRIVSKIKWINILKVKQGYNKPLTIDTTSYNLTAFAFHSRKTGKWSGRKKSNNAT